MLIKPSHKPDFDREGHQGYHLPLPDGIDGIQFLIITTDTGHDHFLEQTECDFFYYILEGKGEFIINEEVYPCEQGDLLVVEKGSIYTFDGKLKMLLTSQPQWTEKQEKVYEKLSNQ
jgi:mannose-6-phosphate isomerase-like protein (cupin superfamily)